MPRQTYRQKGIITKHALLEIMKWAQDRKILCCTDEVKYWNLVHQIACDALDNPSEKDTDAIIDQFKKVKEELQ